MSRFKKRGARRRGNFSLCERTVPSIFCAQGASVVEFALVASFLIVLIYGFIEVGRLVLTLEDMSALSREITNYAYRACPIPNTSTNSAEDLECLTNDVIGAFQSRAVDVLGSETYIALKAYHTNWESEATKDSFQTLKGSEKLGGVPIHCTFSYNELDESGSYTQEIMQRTNYIIVGEVFHYYRPLVAIPFWSARTVVERTMY